MSTTNTPSVKADPAYVAAAKQFKARRAAEAAASADPAPTIAYDTTKPTEQPKQGRLKKLRSDFKTRWEAGQTQTINGKPVSHWSFRPGLAIWLPIILIVIWTILWNLIANPLIDAIYRPSVGTGVTGLQFGGWVISSALIAVITVAVVLTKRGRRGYVSKTKPGPTEPVPLTT